MSSKKKVMVKKNSSKVTFSIDKDALNKFKIALAGEDNNNDKYIQELEAENAMLRDFLEVDLGISLYDYDLDK
jgi:hypothetical protein